MDIGSGHYAFMIENRSVHDSSWWRVDEDQAGHGFGVVDDLELGPRDAARALLDAYFDYLVDEEPVQAAYFLYDDYDDTQWRIRLWDIAEVGYDAIATVWPLDARAARVYPISLSSYRFESTKVITPPALVAWKRLRAKQEARQAHVVST